MELASSGRRAVAGIGGRAEARTAGGCGIRASVKPELLVHRRPQVLERRAGGYLGYPGRGGTLRAPAGSPSPPGGIAGQIARASQERLAEPHHEDPHRADPEPSAKTEGLRSPESPSRGIAALGFHGRCRSSCSGHRDGVPRPRPPSRTRTSRCCRTSLAQGSDRTEPNPVPRTRPRPTHVPRGR